ncbi:MAG: prepilin-type N-terminal cleavage/methylation domain-containing protein [Candidatus Pacebacteria bacterium]|nr:prepilin-type N-terminal cleavage/methylation domain-containing protein [Candidatus Paceibacterota bacterium]
MGKINYKMSPDTCHTLPLKIGSTLIGSRGFSFLELMTVIAIIGVMTSIVVPYYAQNRNSKALSFGLAQVVSDVRMIQNYAYSTLASEVDTYPAGGYGIYFLTNSNEYIIFADNNNDQGYDGVTEDVKTVYLSRGVKIISLKIDGIEEVDGEIDLVFTPPYGKVFIDGQNKIGLDFINLEIVVNNTTGSKSVMMSSSGLID